MKTLPGYQFCQYLCILIITNVLAACPTSTKTHPLPDSDSQPSVVDSLPAADHPLPVPDAVRNDSLPPPKTEFEGFGRNSLGGNQAGSQIKEVTSLEDSGPGTLRNILAEVTGPTVVRFQSSGTILLQSIISLPSQLTIDGREKKIVISGKGFVIQGQQHIILQNLRFQDTKSPEDAIMIRDGSHDIVIDHCAFDNAALTPEKETDELISIIFGSTNITISWCKFDHNEKAILIGNGDAPAEVDKAIAATLHHNHFHKTGRRHPFLRYGKVDMYNNYIQEWHQYRGALMTCGEPGYTIPCGFGTLVTAEGEILLESNRYDSYDYALELAGGKGAFAALGGKIQAVNNSKNSSWITLQNTGTVFSRPYPATIEAIDESWIQMMKDKTGNTL